MARKYEDIFKDYEKYSKDATLAGATLQTALGIGDYLGQTNLANQVKYEPPARMTPRTISLTGIDVRREAMKDLNKALLTNLKFSRETGQDVGASLIAGFQKGVAAIDEQQAKLDVQRRDTEAQLNFEAGMKADLVNTQMAAKDAEMEFRAKGARAGMKSKALSDFTGRIANVSNIISRDAANRLSAELGIKGLSERQKLIDYDFNKMKKVDDYNLWRSAHPQNQTADESGLFNFEVMNREMKNIGLDKNDYVYTQDATKFNLDQEEEIDDIPFSTEEVIKADREIKKGIPGVRPNIPYEQLTDREKRIVTNMLRGKSVKPSIY